MNRRKAVITVLVLLSYTALVWLLGWWFLRGSGVYWPVASIFTACGVTIATVYWLVAKLATRAPSAAPAQAAPEVRTPTNASDPDLLAVQSLFSDANARLAASPRLASQSVRPTIYDLPAYVIAGAEGSGKTSTFLAAGLEPEALAGQIYAGSAVIPTQVANLWYAKGALIAEASGRFFSDDGGRWTRFLTALHVRSRQSFLRRVWGASAPVRRISMASYCLSTRANSWGVLGTKYPMHRGSPLCPEPSSNGCEPRPRYLARTIRCGLCSQKQTRFLSFETTSHGFGERRISSPSVVRSIWFRPRSGPPESCTPRPRPAGSVMPSTGYAARSRITG